MECVRLTHLHLLVNQFSVNLCHIAQDQDNQGAEKRRLTIHHLLYLHFVLGTEYYNGLEMVLRGGHTTLAPCWSKANTQLLAWASSTETPQGYNKGEQQVLLTRLCQWKLSAVQWNIGDHCTHNLQSQEDEEKKSITQEFLTRKLNIPVWKMDLFYFVHFLRWLVCLTTWVATVTTQSQSFTHTLYWL